MPTFHMTIEFEADSLNEADDIACAVSEEISGRVAAVESCPGSTESNISNIYPDPKKKFGRDGKPRYCFNTKSGDVVTIHRFDSRELAVDAHIDAHAKEDEANYQVDTLIEGGYEVGYH